MKKIAEISTLVRRKHPQLNLALLAAAAALATAGSSTWAATPESGWYGTVNMGRSSIDANVDNVFANQGITSASSIDNHDKTYSLGLGYQLNRNFALEGGYTDLGKFDVGSTIYSPAADSAHGRYKVDGWNFVGVGIVPLQNGFSLYGKAGVFMADVKLNAASDTGAVPVNGGSKSSSNGTYGLGTSYDFGNNVIGKLEWNRYKNLGDSGGTGKVDLDAYTVGVSYRF
jgi:OOP family OmpA-OmpF porin